MDLAEENLANPPPPLSLSSLPLHLIPNIIRPISPPTTIFLRLSLFHHRQPHRIAQINFMYQTISPDLPPHPLLIVRYFTLSLRTVHLVPRLCLPPLHLNQKSSLSLPTHSNTHLMCQYRLRGPILHLVSPSNVTPITTTSSSRHE